MDKAKLGKTFAVLGVLMALGSIVFGWGQLTADPEKPGYLDKPVRERITARHPETPRYYITMVVFVCGLGMAYCGLRLAGYDPDLE